MFLLILYFIYLQAIFIAYGPAFKRNLIVDAFENIQLYNLLAGHIAYFAELGNVKFSETNSLVGADPVSRQKKPLVRWKEF